MDKRYEGTVHRAEKSIGSQASEEKRCSTLFMVRDGEMETTQRDHFYLPYGKVKI